MFERITSHTNPKVKNLIKLGKGRGKDRKESFIIEGTKEIEMAIEAGVEIQTAFYCPEVCDDHEILDLIDRINPARVFEIPESIYRKVAYRDSTGGLLLVATSEYTKLDDIKLTKSPLILVLESVEKPGNLGAVLRTADAANIDLVILCDPLTDLFNPNIIRSSIGCIFTVPVVVCSSEDAIAWLKKNKISVFATDLATEIYYHEHDFTGPSAIVMGTEHSGISELWLKECDQKIKIPMRGKIDSLNVSTSSAILIFEAARQRGFS